MKTPGAMLFDVFGTLVDWYSSISEQAERVAARAGVPLDGGALATSWRERYQPSMEVVRTGLRPWTDLDRLHRESLDEVLAQMGVALGEPERRELVLGWRRLRPWPDVPAALVALRDQRPIATLSNSHLSLLVELCRYAGLSFDLLLSAELARTYKPEPAVYQTAVELLGLPPQDIMLVACHESDMVAARDAGLSTAYVSRPTEWGPDKPPRPAPNADIVVDDLTELARRLAVD